MKTLLLYMILLPVFARADQGLLLWHLSDIRYSPQFKTYAVITVQPVKNVLFSPIRQRIQVFDNDTGKMIWSTTNTISLVASDIYPADDGEHIVVVRNAVYRMIYEEGDLTQEQRDEIENETVLLFYSRDKPLKSYTVKDLGLKAENVDRGMSRFSAFAGDSPPQYIDQNIPQTLHHRNPLILGESMRLYTAKREALYFNITTGEQLKETPDAFKPIDGNPSIPTDPFGVPIVGPSPPTRPSPPPK